MTILFKKTLNEPAFRRPSNMKFRFAYIVSTYLLLLLVTACKAKPAIPADAMPDIGIPAEEMNTKLHLTAPNGWNSFKIGDVIGLNVEGTSEDQIAFPPDYGARMFVYQNGQWKEIANFMTYPEGLIILSPRKGNVFNDGTADLAPIFTNTTNPVTLRIILVGSIYRDGKVTAEKTAGYIDVNLTPK
jgi:hypothetical protein